MRLLIININSIQIIKEIYLLITMTLLMININSTRIVKEIY